MDTIEVLKEARQLISDPVNWTTDVYARDANGVAVKPDSKKAVCWCGSGAIYKVTDGYKTSGDSSKGAYDASQARHAVTSVICSGIPRLNDTQGHAAVLEAFDKTIAILIKEKEENNVD